MNQYRCETCKNRKTIYGEYACEVVSRKMTKCFYEWVTKVGCASHSDFQSERETVLGDEHYRNALSLCDNLLVHLEDNDITYLQIKKTVALVKKELQKFRQAGEP